MTLASTKTHSAALNGLTDDEIKKSNGRADFMKRFFSVAVSVGFASKIGNLDFLSLLAFPNRDQLHQLILLIFAMTVVVGSWEFYFKSLDKKPLVDWQRFVVDIIIVSLYIVLLLSIKIFDVFFLYINIIMLFHILWDILSMRVYPDQYEISDFGLYSVLSVYKFGLVNGGKNKNNIKGGPFVTLWWFMIFVLLFIFHRYHEENFYAAAFGSAAAYILYRVDQAYHWFLFKRIGSSAVVFAILFLIDLVV